MGTRASALVGRAAECLAIRDALANAQAGRGGAVLMVGESGIGKSRLAAEAITDATAAGMRTLRGRGSTVGPMMPFRPLTEAVLSLVRESPPRSDALGPYMPVLGQLVPELAQGPATNGGHSLVVVAEALLRLTALAGQDRGCLLTLDDLQDADVETLAVLEYVVDNIHGQPVLLIGTIRTEDCAALDLAHAAVRRRSCLMLELDRLGYVDVRLLLASCLGIDVVDVPEGLVDRVWADSNGNPFIAEEIVGGLIRGGALVRDRNAWRISRELRGALPASLARSLVSRARSLGPDAYAVLAAGAVLGRRFAVPLVQMVSGLDDAAMFGCLQAAAEHLLINVDDEDPGWYAFHHPLTAEALLAQLSARDRKILAGRAADAIEDLFPDLPGSWCPLAAKLRADSGAASAAGLLFTRAGQRALDSGAASSAIALLDRACELLADGPDRTARVDAFDCLIHALAEAGQVERALAEADRLDLMHVDPRRAAAIHTRMAWAANVAGRWKDGYAQVEAARTLLGPTAADSDAAPIDAVAAYLLLDAPGSDRIHKAESLARNAATVAERAGLPVVACQAWQLVGSLIRQDDLAESNACFEKVIRLADEYRLPIWRIHGLVRLGGNDALLDGSLRRLELARHEAVRAGAVTATYDAEANIAMQTVLRGDFVAAEEMLSRLWAAVTRLRLADTAQFIALTRAVQAGHRGWRREVDSGLADFRQWGGEESPRLPLAFGLARAFCGLIEEDRPRARADLVRAIAMEEANPTILHLTGRHGLHLLLEALAGDLDLVRLDAVAAGSPVGFRWNRQFALLARATLLGRAGRRRDAAAAFAQAMIAAEPYEVARHLGLRLVAEAALSDGWGEPVEWLHGAEDHFHRTGVPAVASACRALLRRSGVPIRQRRDGSDRIPASLRSRGITVREYEILELLASRLGNRAIAARLHLSPRTVEKHVANLLTKTGRSDRQDLSEYAATLLGR